MQCSALHELRLGQAEQAVVRVDDVVVPFLRCGFDRDACHLVLEHGDGARRDFLRDAGAAADVVLKTARIHIFLDHGVRILVADDELALVRAERNADDGDAALAGLPDVLDEIDVVVAETFGRDDASINVQRFEQGAKAFRDPELFVIDLRRADEDDANEVELRIGREPFDERLADVVTRHFLRGPSA